MYEEYGKLWRMLVDLKSKASEFDSVDSKIQVWVEIDEMVNSNIAAFLEVTTQQEMTDLLKAIYSEAEKINKSVLEEDIKALCSSINETVKRIESVRM